MSGRLEPVGVTVASLIKAGTITKPVSKTTKVKLDECFGTAKAIEKNDDDCSDEDVADGRRARYEKDQPAGAVFKFLRKQVTRPLHSGHSPSSSCVSPFGQGSC